MRPLDRAELMSSTAAHTASAVAFEPTDAHTPLWSFIFPSGARPYGTGYTHTIGITDPDSSSEVHTLSLTCVENQKDDPNARMVLYEMPSLSCLQKINGRRGGGDDEGEGEGSRIPTYTISLKDTWYSDPVSLDIGESAFKWFPMPPQPDHPSQHPPSPGPPSSSFSSSSSSSHQSHPYHLRNRSSIILCALVRHSTLHDTELVGFEMWIKKPTRRMIRRNNRWVCSYGDPVPVVPQWIDSFVRTTRPATIMFKGSVSIDGNSAPAAAASPSTSPSAAASAPSPSASPSAAASASPSPSAPPPPLSRRKGVANYPVHCVSTPCRNYPPTAKALSSLRDQPWLGRTTTGLNIHLTGGSELVRYSIYVHHILFDDERSAMRCERVWGAIHGPGTVVTTETLNEWFSEARIRRIICTSTLSPLLRQAIRTAHYRRSHFDIAHIFSMIHECKWKLLTEELLPRNKPILVRIPEFHIRNDPMLRTILAHHAQFQTNEVAAGAGAGAGGSSLSSSRKRARPVTVDIDAGFGSSYSAPGVYLAMNISPVYPAVGVGVGVAETPAGVGVAETPSRLSQRSLYVMLTLAESGWVSPFRNPTAVLSESQTADLLLQGGHCLHESSLPEVTVPLYAAARPFVPLVQVSLRSLPMITSSMIRLWYAWNSSGLKNMPALLDSRITLTPDPAVRLRKLIRARERSHEQITQQSNNIAVELCMALEEGSADRSVYVDVMSERMTHYALMSEKSADAVKRAKVALSMWQPQSPSLECSSCIDEVDVMAGCNTACGHRLCYRCVGMMISRDSCPVCKSSVKKVLLVSDTPTVYTTLTQLKEDVDRTERRVTLEWIEQALLPDEANHPCVVIRSSPLNMHGEIKVQHETIGPSSRPLHIITANVHSNIFDDTNLNNDNWVMFPKRDKFTAFMHILNENLSTSPHSHLVFVSIPIQTAASIIGMIDRSRLVWSRVHILAAKDSVCEETMDSWLHSSTSVPFVGRSDTDVSNSAASELYEEVNADLEDIAEPENEQAGEWDALDDSDDEEDSEEEESEAEESDGEETGTGAGGGAAAGESDAEEAEQSEEEEEAAEQESEQTAAAEQSEEEAAAAAEESEEDEEEDDEEEDEAEQSEDEAAGAE